MTGDDPAAAIDQDRIDEAKFLDAVSDLLNLLFAVRARVIATRLQPGWIRIHDLEGLHRTAPSAPRIEASVRQL